MSYVVGYVSTASRTGRTVGRERPTVLRVRHLLHPSAQRRVAHPGRPQPQVVNPEHPGLGNHRHDRRAPASFRRRPQRPHPRHRIGRPGRAVPHPGHRHRRRRGDRPGRHPTTADQATPHLAGRRRPRHRHPRRSPAHGAVVRLPIRHPRRLDRRLRRHHGVRQPHRPRPRHRLSRARSHRSRRHGQSGGRSSRWDETSPRTQARRISCSHT